MQGGPQWCTIESDPGVFTELISKFGVDGVQVEELWGLDDDLLRRLTPVYGLIFLFKYDQEMQRIVSENVLDVVPDGVFFAKQMIDNACATQAIISVLLNNHSKIHLGDTLSNFLQFTSSLDPESRGLALQQSNAIRQAHNSFAAPEPIQIEKAKDNEDGDAFHFISYVPINGFLYEMDGLQQGPRLIGDCDENNWLQKAKEILQLKMSQYASTELRFTLLAVCQNLELKYSQEISALKLKRANNLPSVASEIDYFDGDYILNFGVENIDDRVQTLEAMILDERTKFAKWSKENIRRRHNYFPFVLQLIQALAKNNLLEEMTNRAVLKKKEKLKRKAEEEEDKKISDEDEDGDDKTGNTNTETTEDVTMN